MSPHFRFLIPLLLPLLLVLQAVQAPPPTQPSASSDSNIAEYVTLHRTQTEPLHLWRHDPLSVAQHRMPGDANQVKTLRYLHALENDAAYIHPKDQDVKVITKRLRSMTAPDADVTSDGMRGWLALFEEFGRKSEFRIQTALHPKNVHAQHRAAVERQLNRLNRMFDILDDGSSRRKLTRHLDEEQLRRLDGAYRVYGVEATLLEQAKHFGSELPRLSG